MNQLWLKLHFTALWLDREANYTVTSVDEIISGATSEVSEGMPQWRG
jgi:hypothetical protein